MKKQNGITIIALVITIILLLIIAGISIAMLTNENGILNMADEATQKAKLAELKEELELNTAFEYNNLSDLTIYGSDIKNYINSLEEEDIDNFAIVAGKLTYVGNDEKIKEYCKDLGINIDILDMAILIDHINKTDVVTELTDEDNTPRNYIGTRLYDKNVENSLRWKILVEYDQDNTATNIKGSEWYYIAKGIEVNGHVVEYNYIVNYKSGEINPVSNYKIWDVNSSLGVSEGLVMNVDSTNMNTDNWGNIEKYGDVKYVEDTKSLYFDGDGDYLKLTSPGDFSDGFTFEIYANLDRTTYSNGSSAPKSMGMFVRIPSLNALHTQAMRFGLSSTAIAKFNISAAWNGTGENLRTAADGSIHLVDSSIFPQANQDFYMTFVYRRYNNTSYEDRIEDNWTIEADRIELYIDGVLKGYTYHAISSFDNGLLTWNKEDVPIFIGVTPWYGDNNLFYLNGDVYSCRLYQKSLTEEEVILNYDTTKKWKNTDL